MTAEEAELKSAKESEGLLETFMRELDVDEDIAGILIEEGFTSIEEVAYVPLEEMLEIESFDEDMVEELRTRAKDHIITKTLVAEEEMSGNEPAADLLEMEGMTRELAYTLASKDVKTMEDLAELAVDDLLEVDGMTEEKAAQLIMKAREPWFKDEA